MRKALPVGIVVASVSVLAFVGGCKPGSEAGPGTPQPTAPTAPPSTTVPPETGKAKDDKGAEGPCRLAIKETLWFPSLTDPDKMRAEARQRPITCAS